VVSTLPQLPERSRGSIEEFVFWVLLFRLQNALEHLFSSIAPKQFAEEKEEERGRWGQ
jgi:hypothetical protein